LAKLEEEQHRRWGECEVVDVGRKKSERVRGTGETGDEEERKGKRRAGIGWRTGLRLVRGTLIR
jgi:hypothetical protein